VPPEVQVALAGARADTQQVLVSADTITPENVLCCVQSIYLPTYKYVQFGQTYHFYFYFKIRFGLFFSPEWNPIEPEYFHLCE
jgi:hypothetical protein